MNFNIDVATQLLFTVCSFSSLTGLPTATKCYTLGRNADLSTGIIRTDSSQCIQNYLPLSAGGTGFTGETGPAGTLPSPYAIPNALHRATAGQTPNANGNYIVLWNSTQLFEDGDLYLTYFGGYFQNNLTQTFYYSIKVSLRFYSGTHNIIQFYVGLFSSNNTLIQTYRFQSTFGQQSTVL